LRHQGHFLSLLSFIFLPLHADLHLCAIVRQSSLLRHLAPILILCQGAIIKHCRLAHIIIAAVACMSSSSLLRHGVLILLNVPPCAHLSVITIGGALEHNSNVDASASDYLSNETPLSA
jgi:hypothetical protein